MANMHPKDIHYSGKPLAEAEKAIIMLHGRNAPATGILALESELPLQDFAVIAPEAYNNSWYPLSFMAPTDQNEPWLSSALEMLSNLETELNQKGIPSEHIYFFGFSQGACLCLEYVTRNAKRYGGVAAIIGGLIGEQSTRETTSLIFTVRQSFWPPAIPIPMSHCQEFRKLKKFLLKRMRRFLCTSLKMPVIIFYLKN